MVDAKAMPIRMCMACRRRFPKQELLRHVLMPSGEAGEKTVLMADEAQKRPGRGYYVCSDTQCRERFLKLGRERRKRKGV